METKTPRPLCCVVSDFKFCWQPGSPIGSCHQAFISPFFSLLWSFWSDFPSFLGVFLRVFLWSSLDFGGPLLPLWLCGCEIHFPLLGSILPGYCWTRLVLFHLFPNQAPSSLGTPPGLNPPWPTVAPPCTPSLQGSLHLLPMNPCLQGSIQPMLHPAKPW